MARDEILAIANSGIMWLICSILVIVVVIQVTLFVRLCRKEADRIGYDKKNLTKAVGSGAAAAIGPALAGIVVMISMMALVGAPMTWQRLSIIGAAQTELTVSNIAASVSNAELGGAGFSMGVLTLAYLLMAINGCGWLAMTAIATPYMEKVRTRMAGGDMTWLGLLTAGLSIGVFANFTSQRLVTGAGPATAAITAFVVQYTIDHFVVPKVPKIKGWTMAIALVVAMIAGYLVRPV